MNDRRGDIPAAKPVQQFKRIEVLLRDIGVAHRLFDSVGLFELGAKFTGHTQLGARGRCGLDQVAEHLLSLSADQGWHPDAIIGHSAGAAIALRMTEALGDAPPAVIGINAALGNFKGVAGWLFPMLARLLSLSPFSADLFIATSSSPRIVRKLIAGTGSKIDTDGLALYQRLASDRAHVDATLAMMAQWSLDGLLSRLDQLKARTLFIVGESDSAVPPNTSAEAAAKIRNAEVIRLTGLGHLAHEEAPQMIADRITAWLE